MASIEALCDYLDQLLQPAKFADYCPNGLQLSGRRQVEHIVTGVSANQALIDAAAAAGADLLLVHHGFFWKGEAPCLTGIKRARIAALLAADINLVGYHLPLDAHQDLGNNVQLAKVLGLQVEGPLQNAAEPALALRGRLATPVTASEFAVRLAQRLGREPLHIAGANKAISTIAWCTGAAQDLIDNAVELGLDAYVTGEVSERTVHVARESGIHFFAAGHHATERYGVQALGEHLAQHFGVSHQFIDIDNPV